MAYMHTVHTKQSWREKNNERTTAACANTNEATIDAYEKHSTHFYKHIATTTFDNKILDGPILINRINIAFSHSSLRGGIIAYFTAAFTVCVCEGKSS